MSVVNSTCPNLQARNAAGYQTRFLQSVLTREKDKVSSELSLCQAEPSFRNALPTLEVGPASSLLNSALLQTIYGVIHKPAKPKAPFDLMRSQDTLWNSYMAGKTQWKDMMNTARQNETKRRGDLIRQWDIKPEGYQPKSDEDVVIRSGTDPASDFGRGEFSDEDLTANTLRAWEQLRKQMTKAGFSIEEDEEAGFFRAPELNTVVWKPTQPEPLLSDTQSFVRRMSVSGTNHEVVEPSSAKPKFALEYIVAMMNKGQVGFTKRAESWGKGFQQYETLIQLAKSTHHALAKSGLSEQEPEEFKRLWDLCKMKKSPHELGLFKPGEASPRKMAEALNGEQAQMKVLMKQSFAVARQDLEQQMENLEKRMKASQLKNTVSMDDLQIAGRRRSNSLPNVNSKNSRSMQALCEELKDVHSRLDKISGQLLSQIASEKQAGFTRDMFGPATNKIANPYTLFNTQLNHWMRNIEAFLEADQIAGQLGPSQSIHYPSGWDEPWQLELSRRNSK